MMQIMFSLAHKADLPELVCLPGGTFIMGSHMPDRFVNDTERPAHEVTIPSFVLGKFPVTVSQYRCFNPEHAAQETPLLPVVDVTWHDATAYCRWLTTKTQREHRLPSEAEWEYACRAGSTTAFSFGDDVTTADANFLFDENGMRIGCGHRMTVGFFSANAFGLHEMHGNVCEWVSDAWHPNYHGAPCDGSAWSGMSDERVIRGGAWDYMPRLLRSAWRDHQPAMAHRDNLGFRVAATLPLNIQPPDN